MDGEQWKTMSRVPTVRMCDEIFVQQTGRTASHVGKFLTVRIDLIWGGAILILPRPSVLGLTVLNPVEKGSLVHGETCS